ncbi:aspartate/glutamate racemase family protein [Ihubacter sp. rT4E-8]|uniref:aspartate/glutamate racemase family protein n=1 Tax=Ihubacter sp. rT4E-8 TaxID=3242369 RepID=UPI003CEA47D2
MKTVGIVGGTTWYSTLDLYRYINELVQKEQGDSSCAKMALINVNLQDILNEPIFQKKGHIVAEAAKAAERAGADFVTICSNGLHAFAPYVEQELHVPLLHIVDSMADYLSAQGISKVGLMGVKETTEMGFYPERMREKGIEVLIPEQEDRDFMDHVIFDEVAKGRIEQASCREFYAIAERLMQRGAAGVIMGCTEIGELMHQEETEIPLYDSTMVHAKAIVKACISK